MKKSKYLLPNLFTSANLVSGFLSMIAAHNGQYAHAALVILLAAGLDCLDGKVARLTGSSSAFGVEYDSLADLLSFGMAPGWLLYTWALRSLSPFGWLAAFAFVICGALRLARFAPDAPLRGRDRDHRQLPGVRHRVRPHPGRALPVDVDPRLVHLEAALPVPGDGSGLCGSSTASPHHPRAHGGLVLAACRAP